jgi:uncharacterized protein YcfJ
MDSKLNVERKMAVIVQEPKACGISHCAIADAHLYLQAKVAIRKRPSMNPSRSSPDEGTLMKTPAFRTRPRPSASVGICSLGLLLASVAATASATELGTVLSSTPVTAQVGVPQTQCVDEEQTSQARPSGLGAVAGAVIGGAIGHSAGSGSSRGAATGVGAVAGAVIGGAMESNAMPTQTTTVRQCQNVTRYETRVVGYDVVYEYAGVRYQSRMPQDPGPRIPLNVSVVPLGVTTPAVVTTQTVVVTPQPVVVVGPPRVVHRPRYYGY